MMKMAGVKVDQAVEIGVPVEDVAIGLVRVLIVSGSELCPLQGFPGL